jgi:hypothetical protein
MNRSTIPTITKTMMMMMTTTMMIRVPAMIISMEMVNENEQIYLAINPISVPAVDELVKMLQELENSPSSDADVKSLFLIIIVACFIRECIHRCLGTRKNCRTAD